MQRCAPDSYSQRMQLSSGSQSAIINGLTQHFHIHGSGPVVFAHPGGPGLDWEYLRMTEAEAFLTVVYVEPIGTGKSSALADPTGYTYSRYAEQVAGLADHLRLEKVVLLGHSSGGFVAQRFAIEYPERLKALVLYDTSAVIDDAYYSDVIAAVAAFPAKHPDHAVEVAEAMAAWADQGSVTDDEGFSDIARRVFPLYFRDYWADEERLSSVQKRVRGWLAPQRAAGPVDDLACLPDVEQPTLIMVGRHDFLAAPRWAEQMHRALPNSILQVLEDSGHFGHIETSEEFTKSLVDFVTKLD